MRKALAIFLALVLSISAISEGEMLSETEAPTEEVTIETYEEDEETDDSNKTLGEESEQETPEILSEESEDVSENSVQDIKENDGSDVELSSEEIVNEDIEARTNDAEEILDDTEEATENIVVDDSGSGTSDDEEDQAEQEEEDAATEEGNDDDLVDESQTSDKCIIETPTVLTVTIGETNEEGLDQSDNGSGELDASTETEEEASETEEDDSDVSQERESENTLLEDGSSLETEEVSKGQTMEETDNQTDGEVSGWSTSVLSAPMMLMTTSSYEDITPEITTYRTVQTSGRTTLYASDASNTDTFTFHAYSDDSVMEFSMWINGEKQSLGLFTDWKFTTDYEYSFTYAELYSMLDDGKCVVKVKFHCNKDFETYDLYREITFTKYTYIKPDPYITLTCTPEEDDTIYPGDAFYITTKWGYYPNDSTITESEKPEDLTYNLYYRYTRDGENWVDWIEYTGEDIKSVADSLTIVYEAKIVVSYKE